MEEVKNGVLQGSLTYGVTRLNLDDTPHFTSEISKLYFHGSGMFVFLVKKHLIASTERDTTSPVIRDHIYFHPPQISFVHSHLLDSQRIRREFRA